MGKEVPAATLFVMWLQVTNCCVHFCNQAQPRATPKSGPIHSFMLGTMHHMWLCCDGLGCDELYWAVLCWVELGWAGLG